MDKPTIFISYSHKDEVWKDRLRPHLQALELDDRIVVWDDRKIDAGDTWYPEIEDAINRARVAVCLISADFLASKFCVKEEIPAFLQRRETEGVVILPVLVRPCFWKKTEWLSQIQMLPRDGKSLAADFKDDFDSVFAAVAERIFEVIDNPSYQPPAPPAPIWTMPEKLDTSRLPVTGNELFGRQAQLELLDEAWDSAATNVVSFVAWGGVGKSTLVNKWLERLAKDNYRGAERVYAWSFYSQGTTERATSADLFIHSALEWFGDEDPTAGSPWDKGERLARLIRQHRTLLLLDGMEPLQSSNSFERGKIKDPALSTLVTELARENPGLCVITTREQISDLDNRYGIGSGGSDWVLSILNPSAVRGADAVRQIDLELLSPEAGRALLRFGGVRGTDEELERAAESFGCHALALNLLAVYLQDIPGHHVSAAEQIPDLDIPEAEGKHPRRMIAAFERKLGEGPELEVLRLLGLFDRPADGASLAALRKAPKIPGLTETRAKAKYLQAVECLRDYELIAPKSRHSSDELDAHPLVREHFRQQLQHHHLDTWREANRRLYEHLSRTTKEFPETVEEMTPLFTAIAHGCAACCYEEVFEKIWWDRIQRGEEYFALRTLGAYSTDLIALNSFFEKQWKQPVESMPQDVKVFLCSEVGVTLQALGRPFEAVETLRVGLQMSTSRKRYGQASMTASDLAQLFVTIGDLSQALEYAKQSIELNKLIPTDSHLYVIFKEIFAYVLHQTGRLSEAESAFKEATTLHTEQFPDRPFLSGLGHFHYGSFKLEKGELKETYAYMLSMLQLAKNHSYILSIALTHLILGRIALLSLDKSEASQLVTAGNFLGQAVSGLREAGVIHYLPLGLLARAEWARVAKQFDLASRDLAEAFTIAERGEMRLHLADCYLEFARLSLATGDRDSARKAWETAKTMIEQMGYHRRDGEVAEIEAQL